MIRLILALLAIVAALPADAAPLRVMSFNVRLPVDREPERAWSARLPVAVAAIRRTRPDVIGTQELWKVQGDDLIAALPGWAWFGTDRRGGHADEHMGILYNRRTVRLVEFGEFWLSDTPAAPGSISWGHPYPRMVTWAIFEQKASGRRFRLVNTHLPYRAEDDAAREKGAAAIRDFVGAGRGAALPTVLTGDFNTTPDSAVYRILTATLTDARAAVPRPGGPENTFHAFTGTPDRRIDWILSRGFTATGFETVTDHRGAIPSSDHFPVVAELRFSR